MTTVHFYQNNNFHIFMRKKKLQFVFILFFRRSKNKHEAPWVWYSVIWLLLFEQGHFQEKLQIKNSIILLQRHFRKDSSSVMISYIVFNSPSSFFSLKKETKMKKVEFFSVENTVFSQLYKSSQIWNFPVTGK